MGALSPAVEPFTRQAEALLRAPGHFEWSTVTLLALVVYVYSVEVQRRELLRRLRDAQRAAMGEPDHSDAALLLEGIALRLQADLRWLEACERSWAHRGTGHRKG